MSEGITLADLQKRVTEAEIRKGHIGDSLKTKIMLLVEECGELSKALRVYLKMRIHDCTAKHNLADEFGDVLFVLIAMANRAGIDLTEALLNKIEKDEKKVYKPATEDDRNVITNN